MWKSRCYRGEDKAGYCRQGPRAGLRERVTESRGKLLTAKVKSINQIVNMER